MCGISGKDLSHWQGGGDENSTLWGFFEKGLKKWGKKGAFIWEFLRGSQKRENKTERIGLSIGVGMRPSTMWKIMLGNRKQGRGGGKGSLIGYQRGKWDLFNTCGTGTKMNFSRSKWKGEESCKIWDHHLNLPEETISGRGGRVWIWVSIERKDPIKERRITHYLPEERQTEKLDNRNIKSQGKIGIFKDGLNTGENSLNEGNEDITRFKKAIKHILKV